MYQSPIIHNISYYLLDLARLWSRGNPHLLSSKLCLFYSPWFGPVQVDQDVDLSEGALGAGALRPT